MKITICDVGPRDGLQNEPDVLTPETRAKLANRLAAAGLPRVEVASFVRADRVPQMAHAEQVVERLEPWAGTAFAGLVLNEQGYERARGAGLGEIHYSLGVTEAFQERNAGSSVERGVEAGERIVARAREDGARVAVTFSVAFGCPFEGPVDPGRVADLGARFAAAGADELVLADTIGVATPTQVRRLAERAAVLGPPVGVHLHNTRNTGLANAYAALEAGILSFDASVGGLGGCPFAPKATGNIATEDLVYLLAGERLETRIDLDALIGVSEWLESILGRRLPGQVYRAGGWPTRTTPAAASSSTSVSE